MFLPGDDRALLLNKAGQVYIVHPYATGFPTQLYMQLANVHDIDEAGGVSLLLDQAWDPADGQGGTSTREQHLYIYWGNTQSMRISRFTHAEKGGGLLSRGVASSEKVLWQDTDGYPYAEDSSGVPALWHYGGQLQWGPDTHLYISLGDKLRPDFAQRNDKHSSCIIRVAKDGAIPKGNLPGHVKPPACWAHGIRNGFTSFWDLEPAGSERFFVAEVGGNQHSKSQEDVHLGKAGVNYGWPHCEGGCANTKFPSCSCAFHDDPIFTYAHSNGGACIIGGVVYRHAPQATAFPAEYHGAFFYGDYVKQTISTLTFVRDGTGKVKESRLFHKAKGNVQRISLDNSGSVWYISRPSYSHTVELYRIRYIPPTSNANMHSPTITKASASPSASAKLPFTVSFLGSAHDADTNSEDANTLPSARAALTYTWHFGAGKHNQIANNTD